MRPYELFLGGCEFLQGVYGVCGVHRVDRARLTELIGYVGLTGLIGFIGLRSQALGMRALLYCTWNPGIHYAFCYFLGRLEA